MEIYKKRFKLNSQNKSNLKQKLEQYFQFYGFELSETDKNSLVFFKKFSFLSGWKFNPLNWESEVKITSTNNSLEIIYINEGNSQITPFAFEDLFNSFFNNLESYLNNSIDFKEKNKVEIKKAKRRIFYQFLIIIVSIIAFGFLGKFLLEEFRIQFFNVFGSLIGAFLSLKLINEYWINKFA